MVLLKFLTSGDQFNILESDGDVDFSWFVPQRGGETTLGENNESFAPVPVPQLLKG